MGKIAEILEIAVFVLIITQVIIPWACSRPTWPMFRAKKAGQLLSDIERENQIEVEITLRKELDELRKKHAPPPEQPGTDKNKPENPSDRAI